MTTRDIAVIVGSIRTGSLSRMMAHALAGIAPAPLALEIVEIGRLPLYNQDLEAGAPAEWTVFRRRIKAADAVLFVTPEHNRSVPAALKNAVDVASRPYGSNCANHHLRQSLVFLNMPTLQQPEAYMGRAAALFDGDGKLTNAGTAEFLKKFMQAFAVWIETVARA